MPPLPPQLLLLPLLLFYLTTSTLTRPPSLFQLTAPATPPPPPPPWAKICSPPARIHYQTRQLYPPHPIPLQTPLNQNHNRALLTSTPHQVGAGLGHRLAILNFELLLARFLNLTYLHRISSYGPLTPSTTPLVDNFFGWPRFESLRDDVLHSACAQVTLVNDSCTLPARTVRCARLRSRIRGGRFDQTVVIPDALLECFLHHGGDACRTEVKAFLAMFPEPNTLFQMWGSRCFTEYLSTDFSLTRVWFRSKYWDSGPREGKWGAGKVETPLDARRVHVALHVRRGDFFHYRNRVLIPDMTYVELVCRVKRTLDGMIGADVPVTMHVFSEGVRFGGAGWKDFHDVEGMEKVYVDERGRRRGNGYWEGFLGRCGGDLMVETRVASDTLQSVADMLAADVFVGSASGLSVQVVRNLGRGVMVLPVWEGEVGEAEALVPYDWRHGVAVFTNDSALYEVLGMYVRRWRLACAVW